MTAPSDGQVCGGPCRHIVCEATRAFHAAEPGGVAPKGSAGSASPSLSGGSADEYDRLMEGRKAFVRQAHADERAVNFLEGELQRWQATEDFGPRVSLLITETLAKSSFLRAGYGIDQWHNDCACEREHQYAWDRCVKCGGIVPLFERSFRREVA